MWERIKKFIKRVFSLNSKEIKEVSGVDVVTSSKMEAAIKAWLGVFYGHPPWAKSNMRLTNFAAIVTGHMATLATNEINVNTGTGKRAEYIKQQLERFVLPSLRNNVQLAGVGGWVVLKPYVVGNKILTDVVSADNFFPLRIIGGVVEAGCFIDAATYNDKDYIRIEMHDLQSDGVHITNSVYLSNAVRRNATVPLTTVPQWADLPPQAMVEGATSPLYAIIQMPFLNAIDPASKLPVSIYANAMDTLQELDRIYNEFLWEITSGRRKQIIDITAAKIKNAEDIRNGQDPKIATSDQYLVLDLGSAPQTPFADYTPEMRIAAYQTALNIQLRLLESQCGLSAETFSFDVRSGQTRTATEVLSSDKTTYNTIKSIQDRGMKQALLDLVGVYNLYATLYQLAPAGNVAANVDFGDSVFEDTGVEFVRRKSLADNDYLKKEEVVAWYFGVGLQEAREMMPEQKESQGLFGGDGYAVT